MANKFLGIDSINVLKDYIDRQILQNEDNARLVNLHAYRYVEDGVVPNAPQGGSFDPEGAGVTYPAEWASLQIVLNNIGDEAAIEQALSEGSIWMSVGVAEGNEPFNNWSTPVKISGQNGVSVRFAYSYNDNATEEERTQYPTGVNAENRKEYVWMKFGNEEWTGPTLWAVYSSDASDVLYRYCITAEMEIPDAPLNDVDPNWTNTAAASITQEKPFMWMSWKRVPAGVESSTVMWSEPILYGHYGKDGKDGLDGNIPDYSITLYAMSDSVETAPEFVCAEGDALADVRETNKETWFDLPVSEDATEDSIWWNVVLNINGGTRENPELKDTIKNFSNVRRYSAIDGNVATSVYTKYLFYWSSNQTIPEDLEDDAWVEVPEYKTDEQDGSLWMKMGVAKVDTTTSEVVMVNTEKPWSAPVKLTGPRGPIAYDYRQESLYGVSNDTKAPTSWKTMAEIKTTDNAPYIWEKRYLALYKMKYADTPNADGTFDVVEDSFIKTIGDPEVFRLSGLNGKVGADGKDGANGNRLNTIDYITVDKNVSISNFDEINYFISNSADDTHYTLNGNKFGDFVSGYTGKFTNIGTGNMIITAIDAKIVGSNTSLVEITVKPQESIDLISYNNDGKCEFILIGKPLIEVTNPVENPGALDSAQLVEAIAAGGEVKIGKDITLSTPLIIDHDVTVDLNGHTITGPLFMESGGQVLEGNTDSYVFWVKEGNLTIKGNGKAVALDADYSMAVWCQAGNVIIESGEFRNGGESCALIYASGTGNIVIKGGKFIATPKGPQAGTGDDYTALNLKNGDRFTCSIKAEGGHFYGFDPANNLAESADWWEANPNGFVADGFVSVKNGDYYSVIKAPEVI